MDHAQYTIRAIFWVRSARSTHTATLTGVGLRPCEVRRTPLPRTWVNKGKKKAGPPFLGGGMRWPARPHNGIVIQASKLGEDSAPAALSAVHSMKAFQRSTNSSSPPALTSHSPEL